MGRPRRKIKPVIHQVKLVLTPGEDDDLIRFFATLPSRRKAGAVKAAMRSGIIGDGAVEDDGDEELYDALFDMLI